MARRTKKAASLPVEGATLKTVRRAPALKIVSSGAHAKRVLTKPSKSLTFGSVVIESPRGVTSAQRKKNVRAGQEALERAKTALARPGVTLKLAPGIPKYHVDAQGRLVRVLGRKKQIGKLVNGAFVAID